VPDSPNCDKGDAWLLGKHVPEEGILVLLRGLLEQAAPEAVTANYLVTYGESIEGSFRVTPLLAIRRPVALDLTETRASAVRCLREDASFIAPAIAPR
jgi:hypothetical protein